MVGMKLRRLLLVGGALSAAMIGNEAVAQDTGGSAIEEIVVTARRREENLQTTPVAITAVTADTLEKRNVFTLEQISKIAPNFRAYPTSGGIGSGGSYMRGIGYADNVPGQDSPIGIYLDGVIAGRNGNSIMELVEPQRVEVLRGPQGTLFGRNTTGGAVLITSHVPTDEFSGMVKGSYGKFNAARLQARIDTGLIGDTGLKLSMAASRKHRDGVQDVATLPDNRDPGASNGYAFWFKAVGEWDKLSATLTADYNKEKGYPTNLQVVSANSAYLTLFARSPSLGGAAFAVDPDLTFDIPNATNAGQQSIWALGTSLTLTYEASEHLTFKSISAVRAYKRNDPSSYGPGNFRAPLTTGAIATLNGLYSLYEREQSQRQKSQEIQVLGTVGDFDFVAGGYYFDERAWDKGLTRFATGVTLPSGPAINLSLQNRLYAVDSTSYAAFAQVDWRPAFLDKKLELSGGIRYTKDKRDFNDIVQARTPSLESKNTSFLVSANYQWTDDFMTFVRYSTGYRAGGYNARAVGVGVDSIFQPEKLKSLEGGFKLDAFDRRVRLNGAAFYNKYSNLQTGQFVPPGAAGGGGNIASNADAKYKGFELELQVVPTRGLTLAGSVGYVDPEYSNFPRLIADAAGAAACGAPIRDAGGVIRGYDCANIARFSYFPTKTADVSVTYEFAKSEYGTWSVFANYSWRNKLYGSVFGPPIAPLADTVTVGSQGLLNGRIALSDIPVSGKARASISLFGDNLTNKKIPVQGIDFSQPNFPIFSTITVGDPRTFGIEGKLEF